MHSGSIPWRYYEGPLSFHAILLGPTTAFYRAGKYAVIGVRARAVGSVSLARH